jgi:hypothetical protein
VAHVIASSPAGLNWDQLAGFITGSKLSLICLSRLMYMDRRDRPDVIVGMMLYHQKGKKKKAKQDTDTGIT